MIVPLRPSHGIVAARTLGLAGLGTHLQAGLVRALVGAPTVCLCCATKKAMVTGQRHLGEYSLRAPIAAGTQFPERAQHGEHHGLVAWDAWCLP